MRRAISLPLGLVLLLLLAVGPVIGDEEDRPADRDQIESLMQRIQAGLQQGDATLLTGAFDPEISLEAVEAQGVLQGIDQGSRLGFKLGFGLGTRIAIGQGDFMDAFLSYDVRRIRWMGDDRAEAYVRHQDADGLVQKMQWYLAKSGGKWRFYDYMDLDLGVRFSVLVGVAARGTLDEKEPPAWVGRVAEFERAVNALLMDELPSAMAILIEMEGVDWPQSLEATRLAVLAACQVASEEAEAGLASSGRALAITPSMPLAHFIRAQALHALGRHEEALKHAGLYGRLLDLDAGVLLLMGQALDALGRKEEALTRWREGLEDDPSDLDLLAELLLALPAAKKQELKPYLFQQGDLVVACSVLAETALAQGDPASLALVVETLRARHPKHPDGDYYEGHRHRLQGAFAKAADAFQRGWPKVQDPDEREIFVDWFLETKTLAGQAVAAWKAAPDPDQALLRVAEQLIEANDVDAMEKLAVAAGAVEAPARALPLVQGEVAYRRADFRKARALLEPFHEALSAEAPASLYSPEGEAWGGWDLLWKVEDRLVRTQLKLDRFADARAFGQRIANRDDDPQYLVMVLVVKGEVAAAESVVTRANENGQDVSHLLADEDLTELLARDTFARLRSLLAAGGE